MDASLRYIIDRLQNKLNRTDLVDFVDEIIKNDARYSKLVSIEKLANYLSCDYDELEESYNKLIQAYEDGYGDNYANEYVEVWEQVENLTVDELLDLI